MPMILPQRLPSLLLFGAAVLCVTGAQAQISVGLFGSAANPFTNTPPASEWATLDITVGSSSPYTSPAALDGAPCELKIWRPMGGV